jgi:8-oxo-dGTP diphosphatase
MPDPPPREIQVAAAVIESEGRILIGQKKRGSRHPLKWEFPGGKIEPGETAAMALQRELREELAIDAVIGEELDRYDVQYPGAPLLRLFFFRVTEFKGEPQNLVFEQIVWERPARLLTYDFLEGDIAFVRKLTRARRKTPKSLS